MKRYFALVLALLAAVVIGAHAQGLDDQYVRIFNLIQEADGLSSTEPAKAMTKYLEAQTALQRLQKGSPDWNPKVVAFRLGYLGSKISALSTNIPAAQVVPPVQTNQPTVAATTNVPPPAPPPSAPAGPPPEIVAQISSLREQVQQLRADKSLLEAKLKEALSVQPAEMDPRELAKAQENIKTLQKENDLLKVALESEKAKPAPQADTKALDAAKQTLADANRQLAAQKETALKLAAERDALQAKLNSVSTGPDAAALLAENQLLKQKLASADSTAGKADEASKKLAQAQAEIASLQSDKEVLRLEKVALENRLKVMTTNTFASSVLPAADPGAAIRVQQLEREANDLQKKLDAANKALYGRKGKTVASRVQQLEIELATARARLEVFEARQVPYSAEELALLGSPQPKLVTTPPKSTRKPIRELPAGSLRLVTEAQTWFASRQFDKAEAAYMQVVSMDSKNVAALANLAAVQMEAGRLEQAEKSIQAALAEDPEDAFSLATLGLLRFRQGKFDQSVDALGMAAKLDPENPEIQSHLGMALMEKGMRGPAETALRKAVQLQPNYGRAHFNLAVLYSAQQPPAMELARWHYRKAVAAGHPANADLEKKLDRK